MPPVPGMEPGLQKGKTDETMGAGIAQASRGNRGRERQPRI